MERDIPRQAIGSVVPDIRVESTPETLGNRVLDPRKLAVRAPIELFV